MIIAIRQMPVDAQGRVFQGLLSGIGVICAGAIIHDQTRVHGTATAAGILAAATLGAAVAYGMYDIAVFVCLVVYATLRLFKPLKKKLDAMPMKTGNQHPDQQSPGRPV